MSMETVIVDTITRSPYFQTLLEQLLNSVQSSYFCLNLIVKVLIGGPDGSGKSLLAKTAAKCLDMEFIEHKVFQLLGENIHETKENIKNVLSQEFKGPCLLHLSGYELFLSLDSQDLHQVAHCIKETLEVKSKNVNQPIVFVGSTIELAQVYNSCLTDIFPFSLSIRNPTRSEAIQLLENLGQETCIKLEALALLDTFSTNEYYIANIRHLLSKAELEQDDPQREAAPDKKQQHKVEWLDIGGLNKVKSEIIDTILIPTKYPQLKKLRLRRTGILLHGPPGTGKTLLARAVASECGLNFISVNGPELLSEYVGQSEDNVRKLFEKARDASPSVIFFDELDSLAPTRGQAGDSGGVMDRVVSQILTEMDKIRKDEAKDVFVIAATNRIDLVDPSLQRPGRFDKVLEVPLSNDRESRLQILTALTRKMQLAEDVDLQLVESKAPASMSGADFFGLCSEAERRALYRAIELLETGCVKSEDDIEIVTNLEDFLVSEEVMLPGGGGGGGGEGT